MAIAARAMRRRSTPVLLVAAIAVGGGWVGCATSNGDPGADPLGPEPTASKRDASRPDFEAGFPDAGQIDAAPDAPTTACPDPDDPGSSEVSAKALPATTDAQNTPLSVSGVLKGLVDIDFYALSMTDLNFHIVEPSIATTTSGVELCAFVSCKTNGTTSVSGCVDATATMKTSATGAQGCCLSAPGNAAPQWSCPSVSLDDSADFTITVKQTQDRCTPYTFSYSF
jgi:hypothetical protein